MEYSYFVGKANASYNRKVDRLERAIRARKTALNNAKEAAIIAFETIINDARSHELNVAEAVRARELAFEALSGGITDQLRNAARDSIFNEFTVRIKQSDYYETAYKAADWIERIEHYEKYVNNWDDKAISNDKAIWDTVCVERSTHIRNAAKLAALEPYQSMDSSWDINDLWDISWNNTHDKSPVRNEEITRATTLDTVWFAARIEAIARNDLENEDNISAAEVLRIEKAMRYERAKQRMKEEDKRAKRIEYERRLKRTVAKYDPELIAYCVERLDRFFDMSGVINKQ